MLIEIYLLLGQHTALQKHYQETQNNVLQDNKTKHEETIYLYLFPYSVGFLQIKTPLDILKYNKNPHSF